LTRSGDTWKSGVPGEPGNLNVGSIAGCDIRRYPDAEFNCGTGSAWVIKVGVAKLVRAAWLFTWVGREVPGAETWLLCNALDKSAASVKFLKSTISNF
jgi:hypothetical protein